MHVLASELLHHVRHLSGTADARPDPDLLARFIADHDEAAFAALVARHGPMVLRLCRRVLRDETDAEDAFQAAFLILARQAGSIRKRESLAAFLHGVALRVAHKARTTRARRRDRESRVPAAISPAPASGLLDELTARDLLGLLDEEIQRLPGPYRAPLILCCVEGRSQEEAAGQLGCTAGALRGRLQRGRALLQTRLASRGLTLGAALTATALTPARALSARLSATAVRAAISFAAGGFPTGAAPRAVALTAAMLPSQGGLKVGACVLLLGLLAGAVVLARTAPEGKPPPPRGTPAAIRAAAGPPGPVVRPQVDADGDPLPPGALARMGTRRFRHAGGSSVAFAPDGRTIASGGLEYALLLDSVTGREMRRLFVTTGDRVQGVAFTPDGKRLVAHGGDRVAVLDLATGKPGVWYGRSFVESMTCFALSGDGKSLAAASRTSRGTDHVARVWELGSRKERARFTGHTGTIRSVAFSPDGRTLASISEDGSLRLWDAATGTETRKLALPAQLERWIAPSLLFAPDGRALLLGGTKDGKVHRWDVASGKPLSPLQGHTGPIRSLAFLDGGKKLLSAADDSTLRVWDLGTGKQRRLLPSPGGRGAGMALSPDGKTVAVRGYVFRMLDLATGKEVRPRRGHQSSVTSLALSPDGTTLASVGSNALRFWEASTGREMARQAVPDVARSGLAWSPDGKSLLTAGAEGAVVLRDRKGKPLRSFSGHAGDVLAVAFSPDGKTFASGGMDKTIRLWDLAGGKELKRLKSPVHPVSGLAFSPDGRTLADVRSLGPTVTLWDVATGKEVRRLRGGEHPLRCIAFSPDGRSLASAGICDPIHVWDVSTGKPLRLLDRELRGGRTRDVWRVAFSPDGRALFSAENDGAAIVWEVATGKQRAELRGHNEREEVYSLSLSADGTRLAAGSGDTTAVVWDLTGRTRRLARPTAPQREALWRALAGDEPATAYEAICQLVNDPAGTLPLLAKAAAPNPPRRSGEPPSFRREPGQRGLRHAEGGGRGAGEAGGIGRGGAAISADQPALPGGSPPRRAHLREARSDAKCRRAAEIASAGGAGAHWRRQSAPTFGGAGRRGAQGVDDPGGGGGDGAPAPKGRLNRIASCQHGRRTCQGSWRKGHRSPDGSKESGGRSWPM